jgi:acyl-CoA synthetase (AMP-forming)/AMP-acid ligase II
MLIRGGENIYCVEVENALYEHPGVIDAAVVGIPHRSLGRSRMVQKPSSSRRAMSPVRSQPRKDRIVRMPDVRAIARRWSARRRHC